MMREQEGSEIVLQLTHGDNNPRNSEGAFAMLADGRILFAYSRFYGTGGDDHGFADICVRTADATGRGWSAEDTTLVKNEGGCNVMSVSLLRLLDGRIALFYLVKNGLDDCCLRMRVSADEALERVPSGVPVVAERGPGEASGSPGPGRRRCRASTTTR